MSNWFYVRRWQIRRFQSIGIELNKIEAKYLFRSMIDYSQSKNSYFALITKDDKWKVVSSKEDIKDWTIISLNNKK